MVEPNHKVLVQRFIDWDKVEARLARYPHIKALYPLESLRRCSQAKPYYCHYLAWRLGTWDDTLVFDATKWFDFFEDLIANASRLDGWKAGNAKKDALRDCSFDAFWGFLWELQMAKFVGDLKDVKAEWMKSGPDLKLTINEEFFFVECYTYRKSFAILEFIQELCTKIDYRIRVRHAPFLKLSLPKDDENDTNDFLDRLFKAILDRLQGLPHEPKDSSILFSDPCVPNFIVCLESDNLISPSTPPELFALLNMGEPEPYLKVAIKESVSNKKKQLEGHHPNLLAINYLLSLDYQIATALRTVPDLETLPEIWNACDAVLLASCGINELPSPSKVQLELKPNSAHPASKLIPWKQARSDGNKT